MCHKKVVHGLCATGGQPSVGGKWAHGSPQSSPMQAGRVTRCAHLERDRCTLFKVQVLLALGNTERLGSSLLRLSLNALHS